jgi:DeoR family transcriptional regulator, catabolite repression regulator
MALNERQIKILQVVNDGNTTGEAIADAMGSSMQMLSYYIGQMVEDGYLKAARVYDNELRDFVVVRAYLTPEGQDVIGQMAAPVAAVAAVESPAKSPIVEPSIVQSPIVSDPIAQTTTITPPPIELPVDQPISPVQSSPVVATRSIDYTLVGESLRVMGELIAQLPEDWKEMAEVYLDDLQNEVNIAYRRRPVRLKAYLLSLLRMLLPIVDKIPQGEQLIQQARVVSQELQIPVKLPGDS